MSMHIPTLQSEPTNQATADKLTTEHRQAQKVSPGSSDSDTVGSTYETVEPVDVGRAEADFEVLRRELSRKSSLHRNATRQSDLEKEVGEGEHSDFDLLEYMRNSQSAHEENGFKRKHIGVVWDKLSVTGGGGKKVFIRRFPDAVTDFIMTPVNMIRNRTRKFPSKKLLHEFDGCARPGEMVLVLGRPGSGCSTFLKAITNQRGGFLSVDGDVSYGGISAAEMAKRFRGEVVYNQEDDIHQATLTVAQTLRFALNTKTPGKLLPDETRKYFKTEVMNLLLRMLGISHTKNTLVGSAWVRGVSGGERKRVSIAEMMTTRASVCSWDNSTRGLDASTALDYAKSLRILTDVFKVATFVTLYQAGQGIYDLFDKVLLIDEGRQVFFGPASEARPYMLSLGYQDLPRQPSPDFLTGCTDPNERQLAPGFEGKVPTDSAAFEAAFKASEIHARMMQEREEYRALIQSERNTAKQEFFEAVTADKRKGARGPYTVSFWSQIKALVIRQLQIKWQNQLDFWVSLVTTIVVALIAGSVYFQLPRTAAGAFTRGGVVFMSVLFNSFQAFSELPSQMLGRNILWKQVGYGFYPPAALSLAGTIADAPMSAFQILLFAIIVYFMSGLAPGAGAFFTFYVVILGGYFALAAFFRLLGTLCSNFDVASRLASVLITFMVVFGGYLIPVFSMPRWLFWIYYINPLNYAFSAGMMNEFGRIDLECVGPYISPRNIGNITKYPTTLGPNQVCTLVGSSAGNPVVPGADYVRAGFEYDVGNVWRNFGITLIFFLAFALLQAYLVGVLRHGADSPQINVFAPEDKETKELNEKLQANKVAFRTGKAEQDLSDLIQTRKAFTWEDLTYRVPVPGGELQLLDNVFGYVKPGTLTALMGASGAGKTTLLDVLANRKTIGVIGGDMLVAGRLPGRSFSRGTAYCEQLDTHESTATVREAFRFSAYLRQPPHVSKADKDKYVEEVIQLLELEDLADAAIGWPGFGLDVEARKRVTIGVELSSKPQILLFLDEPTSGLDGQSAFNLVRFLRKLAAAGQAILCTIHQPNALLFEHFDRLLLLKRGGRCIYFGDIGKDSNVLCSYFAKYGAVCPPKANPAEYMLEAIGAGSQRMVGKTDWADIWLDSEEFEQVKREIVELKKEGLATTEADDPSLETEFATNFMTQLKIVSTRTFVAFWRNADYGFTRLFSHCSIALILGLTFLKLGHSVADLQYRAFVIFFATVLPAIIIAQIEPTFIMARAIFIRESSSRMYNPVVFALSQLAAETPYSFLCAVAYFILFYYPSGFNTDSSRAGYQFLIILWTEMFAVTLGQAVAALSPSIQVAAMANPFLMVIFSLFCGVAVPKPQLPGFFREWMYNLDPLTRLISGMLTSELHGLTVECLEREYSVFTPPAGQTCQDWAGDFVSVAGGYLANPAATDSCQYCAYASGDQFYNNLGISFDQRWRDFGIFIAFGVFNCFVAVIASKYLKYSKR